MRSFAAETARQRGTLRRAAARMRAVETEVGVSDPFLLAVANLLDSHADVIARLGLGYPGRWSPTEMLALEAARAYLGEASDG